MSIAVLSDIREMVFVHASAHSPGDWLHVTGTTTAMPGFRVSDAKLILCGHVHRPALCNCDRLAVRPQARVACVNVIRPIA